METFALHKNAMVAPLKARMTIDLIRGKKATTALDILKNTNTKSARLIEKVLESAMANATNNFGAKVEDLVVSECYINPGVVLRRWKPASRSRVDKRYKRTSHITVKVSDGKEA